MIRDTFCFYFPGYVTEKDRWRAGGSWRAGGGGAWQVRGREGRQVTAPGGGFGVIYSLVQIYFARHKEYTGYKSLLRLRTSHK